METRSETFVLSAGHRRTRSDYGVEEAPTPPAPVDSVSRHRRLSKRLSLETRPTVSTWQRPGISNELPELTITDDVGNPLELERTRRGGRNAGREDSGSSGGSSDESVQPQRVRRPQSAWNSRSGRRPHFTLSDMDATGGNGNGNGDDAHDERTKKCNATRRKSNGSGSGSTTMTSVQRTTPETTARRRTSQIPVRADQLHPATTNHVDQRPRRHSFYDIGSHSSAGSMMDFSRDQEAEVESTSGCGKSLLPPESSRRRSLTDARESARMRVLDRLTRQRQTPEEEMTSSPNSRQPRKLDPIMSPNVVTNVSPLRHDEHSTMTSSKAVFDYVTSGVGGVEVGDVESSRVRPAVSRKAKALMMM